MSAIFILTTVLPVFLLLDVLTQFFWRNALFLERHILGKKHVFIGWINFG